MPFEGPLPAEVEGFEDRVRRLFRENVVARTYEMEDRLVRFGWCQHRMMDERGGRCFIGALEAAGYSTRENMDPVSKEVIRTAQRLVYGDRGMFRPRGDMARWNDAADRTKADVLALLGQIRAEFGG